MIDKSELLNPRYFILRYYNPSPGNPVIKNMDFDNDYIYATWTNGDQTKTPIKKIEDRHYGESLEGIIIWLTNDISIFLGPDETGEEYDEEYDED